MTDRAYPSRFHEWFDQELTELGWGDREAGRRIGVNHVTIGDIRNGSTRTPRLEVLMKIADAMGRDLASLRRWLTEPATGAGRPVLAARANTATLTAMDVVVSMRAYLDELAAQITAGTLIDPQARALVEQVNSRPNSPAP